MGGLTVEEALGLLREVGLVAEDKRGHSFLIIFGGESAETYAGIRCVHGAFHVSFEDGTHVGRIAGPYPQETRGDFEYVVNWILKRKRNRGEG